MEDKLPCLDKSLDVEHWLVFLKRQRCFVKFLKQGWIPEIQFLKGLGSASLSSVERKDQSQCCMLTHLHIFTLTGQSLSQHEKACHGEAKRRTSR